MRMSYDSNTFSYLFKRNIDVLFYSTVVLYPTFLYPRSEILRHL